MWDNFVLSIYIALFLGSCAACHFMEARGSIRREQEYIKNILPVKFSAKCTSLEEYLDSGGGSECSNTRTHYFEMISLIPQGATVVKVIDDANCVLSMSNKNYLLHITRSLSGNFLSHSIVLVKGGE